MISIHETQSIIQSFKTKQTVSVSLSNALGRTLSQNIVSPEQIPPFNKSAMDGYACKYTDIEFDLDCIETVSAGMEFNAVLETGQCVKIMTGAPVPQGADCVFMYEDSQVLDSGKIRCLNKNTKKNICYIGEDIGVGDIVILKNTFIEAQHIAILASLGIKEVKVYKQLSVGIIATGTELVEYYETTKAWQIRNSNSPLYNALVPYAKYYGIVSDNSADMLKLVSKAFNEVDVLLVTGGASDSEFDLVPKIIADLGFEILVRKVAMQPGKPFMFAHKNGEKFCFGLSGNPVSSYIQTILFVTDFLRLPHGLELSLPILHDFSRKKTQRTLFIPVELSIDGVKTVSYNGSAHIAAFANANAIMTVPQGVSEFKKGDLVRVRQI